MIQVPKQWDEQYLQEAIADEIALAAVHPKWHRRFIAPSVLSLTADLLPAPRRGSAMISPGMLRLTFSAQLPSVPPHWRRDWIAGGELSTDLGLSVRHDLEEGTVSAGTGNRRRDITERYEDHPDRNAATWAAIVRAAIQLCEERGSTY